MGLSHSARPSIPSREIEGAAAAGRCVVLWMVVCLLALGGCRGWGELAGRPLVPGTQAAPGRRCQNAVLLGSNASCGLHDRFSLVVGRRRDLNIFYAGGPRLWPGPGGRYARPACSPDRSSPPPGSPLRCLGFDPFVEADVAGTFPDADAAHGARSSADLCDAGDGRL